MDIHTIIESQVYEALQSSKAGLDENEARRRLEKYGPNQISELPKTPLLFRFLANFYHFFAILLWIGGALSFVARIPELGWAIIAVIFINAIFSFWQEYKAEKATEALKRLLPSYAKVLRGGEYKQVLAQELVPGDLMILEEGDSISADARLIQEFEMKTNNSTLTGESAPRRKTAEPVLEEGLSFVEIPNLVFTGTSVASGSGRAVIFATGMDTQFGKIAYLTQTVQEDPSPLQREMAKVTKLVAVLAIGMGVLFFFLGTRFAKLGVLESFIFAIGIIVANVPEGLLPTVTLSLAMGVQRMAKRNALIKKLSSVETLGSTTVICTDKTGTLTQNEMTVREIWADGQRIVVSGVGYKPEGKFYLEKRELQREKMRQMLEILFQAASFCNSARLVAPSASEEAWRVLGDPTEAALLVAAEKGGFDLREHLAKSPRLYLLPFDSFRKRMSSVHEEAGGQRVAYVKGAPLEILNLCEDIRIGGKTTELTDDLRGKIKGQNDVFARSGLRVLGLSYRRLPPDLDPKEYAPENVERGMTFLGLMAMMDPPRPEVEEAVKRCGTAGVRIVMITGDYGLTAESVARRIGIVKGSAARIVTGADLDQMGDDKLSEELSHQETIFARVSPEHKMRIVSVLKGQGETVAVTGDGVNDAPALKRADIGVAMGIAGTDVAKEAAEMVLTDDNFASIVNAIEEGRAVFDNIRRFVTYIFASNIPEIVPFILMVLFQVPLPLTILQILAIDLGTDMVPALALGTELPEPGVMERPPRPRGERLLNKKLLVRAYFFLGPIEATLGLLGFLFMYVSSGVALSRVIEIGRRGPAFYRNNLLYKKATTMSLAGVVTSQVGNGLTCRTERESIFSIGLFSNRLLLWGILTELVLINILVYVPVMRNIFGNEPLAFADWLLLITFAPVILLADELRKFLVRRFWPKGAEKESSRKLS
jgi:magnesium-transporting ATPase (P-type)